MKKEPRHNGPGWAHSHCVNRLLPSRVWVNLHSAFDRVMKWFIDHNIDGADEMKPDATYLFVGYSRISFSIASHERGIKFTNRGNSEIARKPAAWRRSFLHLHYEVNTWVFKVKGYLFIRYNRFLKNAVILQTATAGRILGKVYVETVQFLICSLWAWAAVTVALPRPSSILKLSEALSPSFPLFLRRGW